MKKVFITGGAGFIGSHVCRILLDRGYQPVIYDAFIQYISPFESPYRNFLSYRFRGIKDKMIFHRGDTRDKSDIRRAILEHKPSIIIHLANLPIADLSFTHTEEAIGSIIHGTTNLLDTITEVDFVERFVYASSSMIYGDFQEIPAPEDHPKQPKDIYGGTKYAAEILIETFGRRHGMKYTIIRPSAVYGPTDINRRVSQIFIENAISGKPLTLHGGDNTLDFTFIEDIAEGIVLASISPKGENQVFNITCGEGRSLLEYCEILKQYYPKLELVIESQQFYRPKRGALSIAKARELLGYNPKYSLEKGIEAYVDFFNKVDRHKEA